MPKRRELPFNPLVSGGSSGGDFEPGRSGDTDDSPLERVGASAAGRPPDNAIAALMETPPGADVVRSQEEWLPLRDVIEDAIQNVLTERERWIFNATVVERKAIREIAAELNLAKSWVDRLKHRACRKLEAALSDNELILAYVAQPLMMKAEMKEAA